jgi:hypothetical protein
MNAASEVVLDMARQDLTDKIARAELHAQRREARSANHRPTDSGQPAHRRWTWLRLASRHA